MDINNHRSRADLMLSHWNGSDSVGNPIHLHSHLPSHKSEHFKTLLSGRWSAPVDYPNDVIDFTIKCEGNRIHLHSHLLSQNQSISKHCYTAVGTHPKISPSRARATPSSLIFSDKKSECLIKTLLYPSRPRVTPSNSSVIVSDKKSECLKKALLSCCWSSPQDFTIKCEGNPIHLHSHFVSQKLKYLKTLLSGRWSSPQDFNNKCEGNSIHLHFHLLSQKAESFKTLLSGSWRSRQYYLNDICDFTTINRGITPHEYARCVELLYAPEHQRHLLLSRVSETLRTLQVASEWRIKEAAEACMEYLEAIPWSDDEALQIKILISSLQIEVGSNMSARLSACQSQYLKSMEFELKQILSSLCEMRGNIENLQTTCYEVVTANCSESCSKQLKDLTKSLVLQAAWTMWEKVQSISEPARAFEGAKILLWFISTLRSMEVTEYVSILGDAIGVYRVIEDSKYSTKIELLKILDDAFKKMASGKMISQRKDRSKLVTNWLPIIQSFSDYFKEKNGGLCTSLQKGLDCVISTLPADDYILICKSWNRDQRDLYSTPAYTQWIENLRRGCNRL